MFPTINTPFSQKFDAESSQNQYGQLGNQIKKQINFNQIRSQPPKMLMQLGGFQPSQNKAAPLQTTTHLQSFSNFNKIKMSAQSAVDDQSCSPNRNAFTFQEIDDLKYGLTSDSIDHLFDKFIMINLRQNPEKYKTVFSIFQEIIFNCQDTFSPAFDLETK